MLDDLLGGPQSEADQGALFERALSYKYGITIESVPLAKLVDAWDHIPRKRKPSAFHRSNCHRILSRFVAFMTTNWPDVTELGGVKSEHVRKFLEEEENRNVSARTWNVTLTILRSAFAKLDENAEAYRRYLAKLPTKDEGTIHRKPYTPEEMKSILDAAKASDELMFRMIVTAFCSGLRRGDLCRLKWRDVDIKAGFVSVKTNKTGERIEFPILPLLSGVMECAKRDTGGKSDGYVFPEAAKAYAENPQSLDIRLKKVLALAGFRLEADDEDAPALPVLPEAELRKKALAVVAQFQTERARAKAKQIFEGYMSGLTVPEVAHALKISKGIVSTRLNEIQDKVGAAVFRRDQINTPAFRGVTVAPMDEDAGPRLKRASLRGWHSFRTSFITQALSAGIPMELVRRVTGHSTVDVVLKHYFKPGREDFSKAINAAMPKFLGESVQITDPIAKFKAEMQEIFKRISHKTLKKDISRMQKLVAALPSSVAAI
jgi:integrase